MPFKFFSDNMLAERSAGRAKTIWRDEIPDCNSRTNLYKKNKSIPQQIK